MRAPGTNLPFIKILKEALMQAPPNDPIKLYRHPLSGHSHRVELFVHLLGLPITLIDVDLGGGGQKAPLFLALNRFGQVPVIDDGGTVVADANAILTYLALKYGADHLVPREPLAAARVQQWMSQAAGALARGAATARAINVFRLDRDTTAAVQEGHWLLTRVEGSLRDNPGRWLAGGEQPTIADVALYTYTAHAPEGGIALDDYPVVRDWIARVEGLHGFVPMARTAVGLRKEG